MPMLTNLADVLRAYTAPDGSKLTVVETAGWKTRGYAGQGLSAAIGHMWHHTATAESAFAYADCPSLNVLINGHSTLPGPLCNIAFGRSGTVYVVAAGVANHAGPGSIGGAYANIGNHVLIGNEMESSGIRNDWTPAQIRIMPYVAAALERGYGGADFIQIGHKEYSSMGKIDPAYIDMDAMRATVNNILYKGGSGSAAFSSVVSTDERSWLDMATKEDVKNALREVLKEPIKREGGEPGHTSIINETAWRTYRDNRTEKKVDTLLGRVYHLWVDWRMGVAGRVHDGTLGALVRKAGYKIDEAKRAEDFKTAEKNGWM